MEDNLVKNAWSLCHVLEKRILVVSLFGSVRVFLISSFNPKSRDVFVNSVIDGQDITEFASNPSYEALNLPKAQIEDRINNIPLKSFDFAHDDFVLINKVKQNKY